MTRRPWVSPAIALGFVGLAIADLAWYLTNQPLPSDGSIADLVDYVFQILPAMVAILLPAILLTRHPDAARRAPVLLFGTILFASVQGLIILNGELQEFFASVSPPSAELPFLIPAATVFNVLVSLTTAFGVAYIAVGLSQVRRHEDRGATLTVAFVPAVAMLATMVGVISVGQIDFGDTPMSPTLAIYLGVSVVLGVIRISAWTYLAAVATRGWLADEQPASGWGLGIVAAGLVIAALALVNLGGVIPLTDETANSLYGIAIVLAYGFGHLALFAAFAVGLPALDGEIDGESDR